MVEQSKVRQLREHLVLGAFYTAFFVLVFVASAYFTFPYDRLRGLIAAKVSAPGRTLTIGELQPAGLSGVKLQDVELTQQKPGSSEPPNVLRVSELTAHVSPWGLLFGDKKGNLRAKLGPGSLEASYVQSDQGQHVEATLAGVDLAQLGLGSYSGLPIKGRISGNVDLELAKEVRKSTGTVALEVKGLHVGDGEAKVKVPGMPGEGLTLDEINAGKLVLALKIQEGVATLSQFTTDGPDLKLVGRGNLRLAEPLRRSRPDLTLELTFSPAYKKKSDRTKAMFDIIGMRSEWQRATTPEGTMRLHVGGTLQAIRGGPAH